MQQRAKRILLIALLISLLIHVVLLTGVKLSFPENDEPESSVIEARLIPLPAPAPKPAPVKAKPTPVRPPKPRPPPVIPEIHPENDALSVPAIPAEPETPLEPGFTLPPTLPSEAVSENETIPARDLPTLNNLPGKLEIQYKLLKGIDGFGIGKASYVWLVKDGRYTITSITEGTGIFSLIQPGKLVQISQGRITPYGLAPDDFWIQRGRPTPDKSTAAHFDYARQTVTISKNNQAFSVPMQENSQDVLSVVFQLVVRSPFPDEMLLHVTSGKNLKPYHARVVGEETLHTALGELKTLHLARSAEHGEDAIDIWLAEEANFIPVKVRIDHNKYGVIEQVITGMQKHDL